MAKSKIAYAYGHRQLRKVCKVRLVLTGEPAGTRVSFIWKATTVHDCDLSHDLAFKVIEGVCLVLKETISMKWLVGWFGV